MISYLTSGSPFKLPLDPFDTSPSFFELFPAFRHKIQVHLVPSLPQALHQPFLLGALFFFFYYWKMVFRNQDTRYVHWYCSVTDLRTSQRTKLRNTYKILCIYMYYTFTPYTTFTFISTLNIYILRFNFFFFFLLHCMAYEILAPRPGIELRPIPLEAQSFNHWTTRKVPQIF